MIRKTWVIVIVGLLLSINLLGGWAIAIGIEEPKKIVIVLDGIPLIMQQTVVALSQSAEANGKCDLSDLPHILQRVYNKHIQKQFRLVNMLLRFPADSPPQQRAIPLLYDRDT